MSVYTGWQSDLLGAAKLPDTAANRRFLGEWHAHADSDCALNPIDLTAKNDHSSNCKATGFVGRSYQRYSDRVWTRTAFGAQMKQSAYTGIAALLNTGDPYGQNRSEVVIEEFHHWGSHKFADYLATAVAPPGPPPTLHAAHAHKGYADLQRSVNHNMPAALHNAQRLNRAALRSLDRARKVRL